MERETYQLPSGGTLQLRGLTGFEVMLCRKRHPDDEIAINAMMLGFAMDTNEDAGLAWLKEHSAGDYVAALDRVQELSGLKETSFNEAYKSSGR